MTGAPVLSVPEPRGAITTCAGASTGVREPLFVAPAFLGKTRPPQLVQISADFAAGRHTISLPACAERAASSGRFGNTLSA